MCSRFTELSDSISDGKVLKLPGIIFQSHMNLGYPCLRWPSMAPLDDLIHPFLLAFENGLDTTVPAIFHPTFHPEPESFLLSVLAEEDSLDPPFNDDPRPYLSHISIYIVDGTPSFIGGDLKPFHRQSLPASRNADATLPSPTRRKGKGGGTIEDKITIDHSLNQR